MQRTIQRLKPLPAHDTRLAPKRVAAYARVSSGKDAMLHSLAAQVSYYSELIQKHGGWEYAGVYADEALTGTKMERPEFQRLMGDCRAGKLDMVIVKSISRFARNTLAMLQTVRELKALGIDVFFEEQNIHSMSGDGELMLTILASFAQEESRSVSENCKWRIRKRFANGELVSLRYLYGYSISRDGIQIDPEQAAVVRSIFADYIAGAGCGAIAAKLREQDAPTLFGGKWTPKRINDILKNEKYTGSALLQKKYTLDHLTKKTARNDGVLPMYYAEQTHAGIISDETFQRTQALMEARRKESNIAKQPPSRHPLTGMIRCEHCGRYFKRKVTPYETGWQCSTYLIYGKAACQSKKIPEDTLYRLIAEVLGTSAFDEAAFKAQVAELRIPADNEVIFVFHSGEEVRVTWQDKTRRDSWTPEMRQQARERANSQRRCRSWQPEQ